MACKKCIDRWGQEPHEYGDSSSEIISWYKHKVFHLYEDIELPPFWRDKILDEYGEP